jgi:hypothetical protein
MSLNQALTTLVGLPMWKAVRSLNLHVLHFGSSQTRTTRAGVIVDVGAVTLHLQCAWRIVTDHRVVVGSGDRLIPRSNPEVIPEDFSWNEPNATLCDEKLEEWLRAHEAAPLVVTAVTTQVGGAFVVHFGDSTTLEVFPDGSVGEQWRIIDANRQHNVFEASYFAVGLQAPEETEQVTEDN